MTPQHGGLQSSLSCSLTRRKQSQSCRRIGTNTPSGQRLANIDGRPIRGETKEGSTKDIMTQAKSLFGAHCYYPPKRER